MKQGLKKLRFATLLGLLAFSGSAAAAKYHVEPLQVNGLDSQKKMIAIVGDGYDVYGIEEYSALVQTLVVDGVFKNDKVFRDNTTAFNVYRIDAISYDYGVTMRRYSNDGQTLLSAPSEPYYNQNTVLGYIQTGNWNRCWMESTNKTSAALNQVLTDNLSRIPDVTIVILNTLTYAVNGQTINMTFGGCSWGSTLGITNGVDSSVVIHELGHSVGHLRDEYVASGRENLLWPGGAIDDGSNCSTVLDRNNVSWSALISNDARLTIPTVMNYSWMNSNTTVGEFEGCSYYGRGVYRPVDSCRMRNNTPQFCPVCQGIMADELSGFLN